MTKNDLSSRLPKIPLEPFDDVAAQLEAALQIRGRGRAVRLDDGLDQIPAPVLRKFRERGDPAAAPAVGAKEPQRTIFQRLVLEHPDELIHRRKEFGVIGGAAQDEPPIAPSIANEIGDVRTRDVVDTDALDILFGQPACDRLHHALGVAVHRAIDDRDTALGFVPTPTRIAFDDAGRILAPDGPVRGRDDPDVDAGEFRNSALDHGAVFPDDIGEVAQDLVFEISDVNFIVEDTAVERAEAAEGIAGEEDAIGRIIGHHRLGPMHHGREMKTQLMLAQIERIAIVDDVNILRDAVEFFEKTDGLLVADDREVRKVIEQQAHRTGVIRLHVVDDEIVDRTLSQRLQDLHAKVIEGGVLDRIDERDLVVADDGAVVGDAARQGPQTLEEVGIAIVDADPKDRVGDRYRPVHSPPCVSRAYQTLSGDRVKRRRSPDDNPPEMQHGCRFKTGPP